MTEPAGAAPAVPTRLLDQRSFRMLCYTRFSSRLAQNSVSFGLVLLIVDETGKALYSSLLVLALVIPSTISGMVAGAAADALPRRLLIVFGDLTRAAFCFVFAWYEGGLASYYIVAIALAIGGQFATAAEGVVVPAIIPRDSLARANAIGHAVAGAAQILGFGVLAPVVLRVVDDPGVLFIIAGGLFLLAAVQAVLIGRVRGLARAEVGGALAGPWWKVGWRAMRADRQVMHAAIELTLISSALIILGGLIPTFIEDVLGLPVDIGALVLLPAALGVALGLRIAGFLAHRLPHTLLTTSGFLAFVVLLTLLTFVNQVAEFLGGYGAFAWLNDIRIGNFDGGGVMAAALVFPLGFAYAIVSVAGQTILNDRVPLVLQGRVNATQAAMAALASSLPVVLAGALTDVLGVTVVMALLSGAIAVVAAMNLRPPRARHTEVATAGGSSH